MNINVPFENKNGSVSHSKSHYAAYEKMRADTGAPVQYYTRRGVPEGFHHECHTSFNGVGLPLAITHKRLAGSIRDSTPKHVFDPSSAIPTTPALFHHNPKPVDYRALPTYRPSAAKSGYSGASDYGYSYTGRGASFSYGQSVPMPSGREPISLPPQKHFAASRTRPAQELPAAGKQSGVFSRDVRGCVMHATTYPQANDMS